MNDSVSIKQSSANETKAFSTFEFINSTRIESINITLEEYKHSKTGAKHFHLAANNSENVFMVAFRTVPTDSTGVAHILEHTALCGSKKYPVRDPFFMMIRRSLNTFMNAMTSSDWTAYPFASQNRKDFDNLLQVYLDATFFSNLDELDFLQEGHRLELENSQDKSSGLVYKGVVFNEMKGAMSSPVSVAWQAINKHVFPNVTYHHNSGGEPVDIPDLTHQQLVDFYESHYHPSNATFFTFGDISAYDHQLRMEELALSQFEQSEAYIDVANEVRFEKPITVKERIAVVNPDDNKSQMIMSWLLGESTDLHALFKAELLAGVLLENSASPLKYFLETTEMASAPSPICGLENSHKEMMFLCGIEGVVSDDIDLFEKGVLEVLNKVAEDGIPYERMEAFLHQLELSQREVGGDGEPYGLQLIFAAVPAAIHRGDVADCLNIDPALDDLREKIKDPQYIKNIVSELLINNNHRVAMLVEQDPAMADEQVSQEKQKLKQIKDGLSEQQIEKIILQTINLEKRQNSIDDASILPKVGIEDVPADIKIPECHKSSIDTRDDCIEVTRYNTGTNGLVYHQIITSLPAVPDDLQQYLSLYSSTVTELGYKDKNYLETQNIQSSISGGINSSFSFRGGVTEKNTIDAFYTYSGKSLKNNFEAFANLLKEHLEGVRFDEHSRIKEIVSQIRMRREQGITNSGHSLAMAAACARISPVAKISNRLSGLEGIKNIIQLDNSLTDSENVKMLAENYQEIHSLLMDAPKQILLINEIENADNVFSKIENIWQNSKQITNSSKFELSTTTGLINQIWTTNTQVNFCAKAFPTVPVGHPDAAVLAVLGPFLKNGYLHKVIREQGGAYGGGATHDAGLAAFKFYSYRDPKSTETLDAFDESIDWLLSKKHSYEKLEEAILGVIGSLDKPGSPAGECKKAFYNILFQRTPEQWRVFRKQVLAVTIEDLKRVTSTYLKKENQNVVIITNPGFVEKNGDLNMEVISVS